MARLPARIKSALVSVLGIALFGGSLGSALAVVDANSAANTNAPTDGAPWSNVLEVNGASAVYIANGWVLTANHVGVADVLIGNTVYAHDGNSIRLTNANGTVTDLLLFHLAPVPPLAPVALVSSTPAASTAVDMIGYGLIAGSAQTSISGYTGFYWSQRAAQSWGNNKVDPGGAVNIDAGDGVVNVISTTFTAPGASQSSNEAQAAAGDSGGGVFQSTASGWQLAGTIVAVTQAVPPNTAVYGDKTYAANIPTYRSQILSIINSTPPYLTVGRSGTNVLLCWPNTGAAYTVQTATNPSATNWTSLTLTQTITNAQVCVSVPRTNPVSFFRLKK